MTSVKSTKTATSGSSHKSVPQGRENLNIGIVLPTGQRHPIGWLATRALGAEIEWRNGPLDIQWFVEKPTQALWSGDLSLQINELPENISELKDDLDVILGYGLASNEIGFEVDPAEADLTLSDAANLLTRYLLPNLTQASHPAPSLQNSILVDVNGDPPGAVVNEIARHSLSRQIPISLVGAEADQNRFTEKLKRHNQSATNVGTDLNPDEFGALIQHAAVVVTGDPDLQHMTQVLHGRSVFIGQEPEEQKLQRDLWSATSGTSLPLKDQTTEAKIQRLAEIVEQTALLRLGRSISDRSGDQERERIKQLTALHEEQALDWNHQRRKAKETIDSLRQEILSVESKLELAENEADHRRRALQIQHDRLNQLEMQAAEHDQGPARLHRSVDWQSVLAQIERDTLKILYWLRRQFGKG
ncbi:MAG TPA: hypothetical protein DCL16_07545 [Acidimicrobiaceae bacterium]|nr:hypothetical protein [Acidimicrobiaceae bacterium]